MRIDWSKKSLNEAELFFSTDLKKGLSGKHIAVNRKTYGRNIIDSEFLKSRNFYGPEKKHNLKAIFSRAFDVMTLLSAVLLIIIAAVYKDFRLLFLLFILFAGMANAAATGIRTESMFAGLYNKARPKIAVVRNKRRKNIYIEEIVPGDIICLSFGDIVPCDARIIEENRLEAHENLFGEPKINRKTAAVLPYDDGNPLKANIVYASTVVTSGNAVCLAVATGDGCLLVSADRQKGNDKAKARASGTRVKNTTAPVLQAAAQKTSSFLTLAKIIFSVSVIIIGLMANKTILPYTVLAMTAAAAVTSDWIPLLCDYAIIKVMDRLAREGIIVKHPKTVDDLNKIDKIVMSRNDTFLGNPMTLDRVYSSRDEQVYETFTQHAPDMSAVLTYAYLCGEGELKNSKNGEKYIGSGLDRAVYDALKKTGLDAAAVEKTHTYIESPKYDSVYGIKSAIVRRGDKFLIAAFGDAENMVDRCSRRVSGGYSLPNDADSRAKLKSKAAELTEVSETVWAVAVKDFSFSPKTNRTVSGDLSDSPSHTFSMDFLGFVCFSPAQSLSGAMAFDRLKNSGAQPVIISESGSAAAERFMSKYNLAQAGADGKINMFSGKELEKINDIILYSEIPKINMFTSVNTAGKLRIINALKTRNFNVAATIRELNEVSVSESVAVSFADMSSRGGMILNRASVISRSLSAAGLAETLKGAATVYHNVKNIFSLLLSFYAAQIFLTLTLLFFGNGGQNSVINSFAAGLVWFSSLILPLFATSLADQTSADKWTKKRRRIKKESGFLRPAVKKSLILASGVILAEILSFTALSLFIREAGENTVKSMIGLFFTESGRIMTAAAYFVTLFASCAFLTMSMSHGGFIFSPSVLKNKVYLLTLLINSAVLILTAAVPFLREFFGLVTPPGPALLICILSGIIPAGINEILKRIN